jgi:hypothetical protein
MIMWQIRTLTMTGQGKQDTRLHADNTCSKYYALLTHSHQIRIFWMKDLQIMWHFWLYIPDGHIYVEGQDRTRTTTTTTTNTHSCNICDTNYHKANIRNEVLFDLKLEILKAVIWRNKQDTNLMTNTHYLWANDIFSDKNRKITYLLILWSRDVLQRLSGSQLVKKFPAFYGTRRFITMFTSARHLSLS